MANSNRIQRRTVLQGMGAGVAAGVLGTWPWQASADEKQGITDTEILIGALGPITGPTAFIGGPARDGMTLAIEKINEAGPINGRKLRLVYEHAATPAESVAAAKKLTENDNVFILVFASGSTGAAAAADYVRSAKIPTYNIFGATPIIREPFARNVFHGSMPYPVVTGSGMVDEVFKAVPNIKKVGVLAGTYAFPQANLKAMMPILQKRNLEVVLEQFDTAATDYTAQLVSFARQRVQAIIVLGSFTEAGFAIKQAPDKGLDRRRLDPRWFGHQRRDRNDHRQRKLNQPARLLQCAVFPVTDRCADPGLHEDLDRQIRPATAGPPEPL